MSPCQYFQFAFLSLSDIYFAAQSDAWAEPCKQSFFSLLCHNLYTLIYFKGRIYEAEEMAQLLTPLIALQRSQLQLMPCIHMEADSHQDSVDLKPSSAFCSHQAHIWCTYIHKHNICAHKTIINVLKFNN